MGRLAVNEVVGLKVEDAEELIRVLERECGAVVSSGEGEGKSVIVRKSGEGIEGEREERSRMVEDFGGFILLFCLPTGYILEIWTGVVLAH